MSVDLHLSLLDFYDRIYKPLRHLASPVTTHEAYRYEIRSLQHYFDELQARQGEPTRPVRVSDLSDELLAAAMAWKLERERSIPTANKLLRHIGAIWRFAKRKGYIGVQPEMEKLTEHKHDPEAWLPDELAALLAAASRRKGQAPLAGMVGDCPAGIWWPALILMDVSTGVRISAVMGIETAKLDLDAGRVSVRAETQKHKADQSFDLKPEVCEVLRMLKPGRLHRVFDDWPYDRRQPANGGGRVRNWQTLQTHFTQILRDAGLSDTSKDKFHKLRRTFATFIAAEAGEIVAQALLGHSGIAVTRRYIDPRQMKGHSARDLLPAFRLPATLMQQMAPPDSAA